MIDINNFNETLKSKGLTIVCAESITAGLLSSTIASVSGASAILKGSIVTYSENLKMSILDVDPLILKKFTAESRETTDAMCIGLKKLYPEASIHVAVTGVASLPKDGSYTVNKDVGKIYVSIFYNKEFYQLETVIQPNTGDERNSIRHQTVEFILESILQNIV